MNINEFKKVDESIKKIFKIDNDLLYAIPWIQPVKILDQNLYNSYSPFIKFNLINFSKLFLVSIFEVLVTFFKVLISIAIRKNNTLINEKIIILSHLINIRMINESKDPYFGNLQEFFLKKNFKFKKILINHTNIKFPENENKSESLVLPKIDSFNLEIKILIKIFAIFLLLIRNSYKLIIDKINPFFLIIVILKSLSYKTQSAIRISLQIKNMISKDKNHILFSTFEGHCFEKMIKKFNPNIKVVLYQNTPLSECQYSFYYYSKNTNPDFILTKNNIYKDYLNYKYKFDSSIISIGDLNYQDKDDNVDININKSILFIPEGIDYEVDLIKNFILKNASNFKSYNLTIRFHPVFPKSKIKKVKIALQNINNLEFSEGSDFDFKKNSYVIYRGSSLIIKCISHGLIPIYLDKNINIDILKIFNLSVKYLKFDVPFDSLMLEQIKKIDLKMVDVILNNFYKPKFNKIKSLI